MVAGTHLMTGEVMARGVVAADMITPDEKPREMIASEALILNPEVLSVFWRRTMVRDLMMTTQLLGSPAQDVVLAAGGRQVDQRHANLTVPWPNHPQSLPVVTMRDLNQHLMLVRLVPARYDLMVVTSLISGHLRLTVRRWLPTALTI
jgi:hypothetical protein